ncbi:MAG: MBL fold metallo-hydrolase [Lachnospiraceae bacterium]|nr:MBL fold metallo-hydrolase [Lachnospiraceae bacterium]
MKTNKTFITTMPDQIGAFLRASECFAALGVNITRVSYNKAVDSHTLFIDAEGTPEQLQKAGAELEQIGYLQTDRNEKSIVLIEFMLRDVPGSVTRVLRLIHNYRLNISYISSQENGSGYQAFKMGLFVEDEKALSDFLAEAQEICPVRVLDYNQSERVFDNSIFYQSFVSGIMQVSGLPEEKRDKLLVNSNLIMQTLDEKGLSPFKTFESISRFAELLYRYRGDAFAPRITRHAITDRTGLILIEPPCGSNTAILQSGDGVLFIDSGYALYRDEMVKLFRELIPGFDNGKKRVFITHADVDHCGLLPLFDEVLASRRTAECLAAEYRGENGYRERNPLHRPYVNICKTLTNYRPADPDRIRAVWDTRGEQTECLEQVGVFDFGELHFEVYEGQGGHLPGETVLIDYAHHVAFTGDIYVNTHGMTREQAEYNRYAPVLMTSVDTDPALCAAERAAILQRLGAGEWKIFGAHGSMKEYRLREE